RRPRMASSRYSTPVVARAGPSTRTKAGFQSGSSGASSRMSCTRAAGESMMALRDAMVIADGPLGGITRCLDELSVSEGGSSVALRDPSRGRQQFPTLGLVNVVAVDHDRMD